MRTPHSSTVASPKPDTNIDPHKFGLHKAAYSISELSEVTSIARSSLYRLISAGEIHPVKMGAKTLAFATDKRNRLYHNS